MSDELLLSRPAAIAVLVTLDANQLTADLPETRALLDAIATQHPDLVNLHGGPWSPFANGVAKTLTGRDAPDLGTVQWLRRIFANPLAEVGSLTVESESHLDQRVSTRVSFTINHLEPWRHRREPNLRYLP